MTLVETYSDGSWAIIPSPDPDGNAGQALNGVACLSPASCVASGTASNGTLIENWDGQDWTVTQTLAPANSGYDNQLFGAACVVGMCDVSGFIATHYGTAGTLVESAPSPLGATATAITSSLNPSEYGQGLTFTAAVTPTDGEGTVSFYVDGASSPIAGCANLPLSSVDEASCTVSGFETGSHNISASYSGDSLYAASTDVLTGGQSVNQAALTITAPSPTITYGQSIPTSLAPTYTGFVNDDAPGSLTAAPTCSVQTPTITPPAVSPPAGSYQITCAGAMDSNYDFTYKAGTLTVEPAALTVNAPSPVATYGQSVPTLTPTYSGFVNGDGADSLTTAPTCSAAVPVNLPSAGSYATSCSGAADSNYSITYKAGSLTVSQALLTVTGPSPSMYYGGSVPTLVPTYSGFVNGDTPASLTKPATCTTTATPSSAPKTYPVTCSGAVDPNYEFTYKAGTVTVKQAPTALTANPAIISLSPLKLYLFTLNATLVSKVTGAPLSGQTVVFKAKTSTLCTTRTNSAGVATCKGSSGVNGVIKVIEAFGYTVTYAGTNDYASSSVTAPLAD